jgi:hypothetical protein
MEVVNKIVRCFAICSSVWMCSTLLTCSASPARYAWMMLAQQCSEIHARLRGGLISSCSTAAGLARSEICGSEIRTQSCSHLPDLCQVSRLCSQRLQVLYLV